MVLTGREKATIFLSILGAETSARVLRYLPDELADLIASGINHLPSPSPAALEEVLGEFNSFAALPESKEAAPRPQLETKKPSVTPKKAYTMLTVERPQVAAFLVSLLAEDERAEALNSVPREKAIIQELLAGLKQNPLHPKLAEQFKNKFKGKLFAE